MDCNHGFSEGGDEGTIYSFHICWRIDWSAFFSFASTDLVNMQCC